MCGLPESSLANKELTQYKAKLAREILVAHLTNATRYQQARLTSLTDALTGVGSRKLLEDKLHEECDRAKRYRRPFSLAIIDLDHFKMVNDALGHATGDEAIRKLADCVKQEKRGPDVLARYGGDEFVLLLPETKAEDAAVLLERVRARVREIRFEPRAEDGKPRSEDGDAGGRTEGVVVGAAARAWGCRSVAESPRAASRWTRRPAT